MDFKAFLADKQNRTILILIAAVAVLLIFNQIYGSIRKSNEPIKTPANQQVVPPVRTNTYK